MPPALTAASAAGVIARFLKARGIDRVFGLCGGHVMPVWMRLDAEGIAIIDVRDERAAVYMAHAYGELTGRVGVALVTAGPGVTNAMTGIANAHVAKAPVLVLSGTPPRPQENRGALQDLVHTDLVRPITRYARTVREPALVLPELDEAFARAEGHGGEPGPVYLDFPTDTLRAEVPATLQLPEHFAAKPRPLLRPDDASVARAAELLWSAKRPLVISGRGARGARAELIALLDTLGAPYLDTGESKGLVPDTHPSVVAAMRGTVLAEADVVVTVGRRLDFQLGYGSPAVFGKARFVRIADCVGELRDNRRGEVELLATPAPALAEIVRQAGGRVATVDRDWVNTLRTKHFERAARLRESMRGAAALACPGRTVAVLTGDGAFGFNAMEIDTAARHRVPVLIVIANNGAWQIEVHDQSTTHGRVVGTMLQHADHAAMARAFGVHAERVERAAELPAALQRAMAANRRGEPALLDVIVTGDAVSSDARSGLAWVPDLQPLAAWDEAERHWRSSPDS